jgi:two-component system, chemotaxis family, response regulator PixG
MLTENEPRERAAIIKELSLYLERVKTSFFSGRLIVNTPDRDRCWVFSFHLGRLNWSGGTYYRVDWWRRHLGVASTRISSPDLQLLANFQQPQTVSETLTEVLTGQQIERKYLSEITAKMFEEVVFDIMQYSSLVKDSLDYEYFYNTEQESTAAQALPLLAIKPYLDKAIEKWQIWQKANLGNVYVNLQLQLQDPEKSLDSLTTVKQKKLLPLLQRGYTLRDIAHATRQPLLSIAQELSPLLRLNAIDFVQPNTVNVLSMLADLDSLVPTYIDEPSISGFLMPRDDISEELTIPPQPLVACIDDSEIVHYHLGQILTEHRYRLTSIYNPLFSIPSLIAAKPDLIFLDLVMPTMNGYEVCSQIRKTPSLKQTPVIILTGKDGMVDKLRSKLVGANDFLTKPVEADAVLRMLFYYLPVKE